MIKFTTTILKFGEQGEKTGWTYIVISALLAQKLKADNKKSFRVKGKLDNYVFNAVALLPMGEGDFIMPFNAQMRKVTGKRKGYQLSVQMEVDDEPIKPSADFAACLADEPAALDYFNTLAKSHQNYFIKWIKDAKTEPTKTKRITHAINALANSRDFVWMVRNMKAERQARM